MHAGRFTFRASRRMWHAEGTERLFSRPSPYLRVSVLNRTPVFIVDTGRCAETESEMPHGQGSCVYSRPPTVAGCLPATARTVGRSPESQECLPLSRTYRHGSRPRWAHESQETFRCRRCKALVGALPSGGRHRNHCPNCLHSRHLDALRPGDRASDCGALMAPVAHFRKRNGEAVLVHRCLGCHAIRHNRVAADDDFDLVLALPDMSHEETPTTSATGVA